MAPDSFEQNKYFTRISYLTLFGHRYRNN